MALGGAQLRHQALSLLMVTGTPASGAIPLADVKVEVRRRPVPPSFLCRMLEPFCSWYGRIQGAPKNFGGHYPAPQRILEGHPRRRCCRGSRPARVPARLLPGALDPLVRGPGTGTPVPPSAGRIESAVGLAAGEVGEKPWQNEPWLLLVGARRGAPSF